MEQKTLLIIDDDQTLTELLVSYFEPQHYRVIVCSDGRSGLFEATSRTDIDVILLDVMMPELDGFEVLKRLRQTHLTPVIMLTARGDDFDRVLGLELGADDYLPKPFNHRELSARVKALIRRSEHALLAVSQQDINVGGIRISPAKQMAYVNDTALSLTMTEFMLLKLLTLNCGEVVTKQKISEQVLGRRLAAFDRSIDMHVSNVRKKLAEQGIIDAIKTVRGAGYTLSELG
ncbi:response regulator transcription factor [Alteromonas facilis]|uniref:response regulator transcription factor n=1 Tax=Alteromonas facilis TaxID=2048004 RepID=UPI000C281E3C|nr:response regulator transcription factor [Alteromonas facilis]